MPIYVLYIIEYPYLIPSIYLDFDIRTELVIVQSSMIIKPKFKECKNLIFVKLAIFYQKG